MKRRAPMAVAALLTTLILTAGMFAFTACGQDGSGTPTSTTEAPTETTSSSVAATTVSTSTTPTEEITLTLDELAQFDGKDGRPAYVAVDGVVYDVSDSRSWPDGTHSRCNLGAMAGKDLSEEIKQAPSNMRALLANMPVVGTLTD